MKKVIVISVIIAVISVSLAIQGQIGSGFKGRGVRGLSSSGGNITLDGDLTLGNGGTLTIPDATGSDNIAISHDGTDASITPTNTTELNIPPQINVTSGNSLTFANRAFAITGSLPQMHLGDGNTRLVLQSDNNLEIYNDDDILIYPTASGKYVYITGYDGTEAAGRWEADSTKLELYDNSNNLNLAMYAQGVDDHLFEINYLGDFAMISVDGSDSTVIDTSDIRVVKGGYNKRINWSFEGWCTHEAATDTVTIGVLPTNAIVTELYVWVQEAFDSDGNDYLYVGYDSDPDAYGTELDVSTTGVKAMTLGSTSKTVDATSRTVKVYYDDQGSDAANGEVHVLISWWQATVNP